MKDAAGNYTFIYENNKYTIMRMGWKQQREFIKYMTKVIVTDEDTNDTSVESFTDEFNEAQDWLLPKIAHVQDGSLHYLKDDYLDIHLESINEPAFKAATGIFIAAISELSNHFFQVGSNQKTSNHDAAKSLENTDYQTQLSKTFSQ